MNCVPREGQARGGGGGRGTPCVDQCSYTRLVLPVLTSVARRFLWGGLLFEAGSIFVTPTRSNSRMIQVLTPYFRRVSIFLTRFRILSNFWVLFLPSHRASQTNCERAPPRTSHPRRFRSFVNYLVGSL